MSCHHRWKHTPPSNLLAVIKLLTQVLKNVNYYFLHFVRLASLNTICHNCPFQFQFNFARHECELRPSRSFKLSLPSQYQHCFFCLFLSPFICKTSSNQIIYYYQINVCLLVYVLLFIFIIIILFHKNHIVFFCLVELLTCR